MARSALLAILAASVAGAPIVAQVQWQQRLMLPRFNTPVVLDELRASVVLPLGGETWEWQSGAWQRYVTAGPPQWSGSALAYDRARGVSVWFSSFYLFQLGAGAATWQWDGASWRNVSPFWQPSPRHFCAMAGDPVRGVVVLFGGLHPDTSLLFSYGETWEWNGATWTQRPVAGPSARWSAAMTYDATRARMVLFGGATSLGANGETWTYDGTTWVQQLTAVAPAARSNAAMAFDPGRGRIVLFGGRGSQQLDDTWEWDGANWTMVVPQLRPAARSHAGMAADPLGAGVLLAGGIGVTDSYGDLWRWDGSAWTLLVPTATPPSRHSHAAAFDSLRGNMLVFGGFSASNLGDFWRWDGARWTEIVTAGGPPPRLHSALAYDVARDRAVLFGGETPAFAGDTWEWDGQAWAQRLPPVSPSPRSMHAMAYDRHRSRVVLFGGTYLNGLSLVYFGDTWEWDGVTWQQRSLSGPAPRFAQCLTFDAARNVCVLYGGAGAGGGGAGTIFDDTWEWDGNNWSQRLPPVTAGPLRNFGMAFDGARDRTVQFGNAANETWEWDGNNWLSRAVIAPPSRGNMPLVYDDQRNRVLLFGGQGNSGTYADLWEYGPVQPASATAYGNGCAGSTGVPTLTADASPWLGDSVDLIVRMLPPLATAALWLGVSRTSWAGAALPLDLSPFGMPGCLLWAGIDSTMLAAANAAGTVRRTVSVPNAPALLGLEVFAQGAVIDPPANAAGLAVTGALRLQVGGR